MRHARSHDCDRQDEYSSSERPVFVSNTNMVTCFIYFFHQLASPKLAQPTALDGHECVRPFFFCLVWHVDKPLQLEMKLKRIYTYIHACVFLCVRMDAAVTFLVLLGRKAFIHANTKQEKPESGLCFPVLRTR